VKIMIDNLDGGGSVDYSAAICPDGPLKIERSLNRPSACNGMLDISDASLAVPVRRGRILVATENGLVLFTGYMATEPEAIFVGVGIVGPVRRYQFHAISDEWLLDKELPQLGGAGLAESGGQVLRMLTARVNAELFDTSGILNGLPVGVFEPVPTENWSASAGTVANTTYAAYKILNGKVTLQPAGTIIHTLSDGDGSLQVAALRTASVKELANDVTVSGEMESAAYVTELFSGDGTTEVFQLSEGPFRPKKMAFRQLLDDSFNEGGLNTKIWNISNAGLYLGLNAAGLTMNGGNGFDGQTTMTLIDVLELGGSLLIEAGKVQLGGASAGTICGLYTGSTQDANCFVGYKVRQSNGSTVVVPFINGVEVGTVLAMQEGHTYTLRIRLHCVETQRVLQTYYAMVDGAVKAFGGGFVAAPMSVVFELQDLGVSSNTPATVLYDGGVATSPASCNFVAVNSIQLFGSIGYCRITQTGSAWVTSSAPNGTRSTRLIGIAGEGIDCTLSATGRVTFLAGRTPTAGELVTITYRMPQRAVARLQDAASVASEAEGGVSGTSQWQGKVNQPVTQSSVDCENAALAVLSFSASRTAAIAGTYEAVNPEDVWPGDVLSLTTGDDTLRVVVRNVEIIDRMTCPETLTYRISFANDWAEGLGINLSKTIAADALLPQMALDMPGNVLANLQQLQVVSASGTALQVDAGLAPPAGGGFEVRRRDWDFGPGVDQDLVLRSPVRSFSIPREGQIERYYVRMYDGSSPPLYSRFSSAVFANLPVSS
jgi:hypothetical protein